MAKLLTVGTSQTVHAGKKAISDVDEFSYLREKEAGIA